MAEGRGDVKAKELLALEDASPLDRLLEIVDESAIGAPSSEATAELPKVGSAVADPLANSSSPDAQSLGGPGLRVVIGVEFDGEMVVARSRGGATVRLGIAPHVDLAIVRSAIEHGDALLVEIGEGIDEVVGVLVTREREKVVIDARSIEIRGSEEIVLRSGRGALRFREDGSIELLGTRISAASRGIFRLVGRALRLN